MTVRIIVAIAENGVIGANNGMPWRLSTDMKRFKALTEGHPIVMGRKTWESFPKRPLPNRRNIVITRNPSYEAEGAELFPSFEAAIKASDDDLWVVGGGEIYAQALPHTDALHVTHIDTALAGDTVFPDIDPGIWRKVSEVAVPAGERDDFATRYAVYERRRSVP